MGVGASLERGLGVGLEEEQMVEVRDTRGVMDRTPLPLAMLDGDIIVAVGGTERVTLSEETGERVNMEVGDKEEEGVLYWERVESGVKVGGMGVPLSPPEGLMNVSVAEGEVEGTLVPVGAYAVGVGGRFVAVAAAGVGEALRREAEGFKEEVMVMVALAEMDGVDEADIDRVGLADKERIDGVGVSVTSGEGEEL